MVILGKKRYPKPKPETVFEIGMHRRELLPDIRLIQKPDTGYPVGYPAGYLAGYLAWQLYFFLNIK
jgi:hypothetical protein